jgi:hypothetical protein
MRRRAALDGRARSLRQRYREDFVELGIICCAVEDHELCKWLEDSETDKPFTSFTAWLDDAWARERTTAWEAYQSVRDNRDDIAEMDMREIPRKNLNTCRKLSSAVKRDPRVLAAAKTKTNPEFVETVRKAHPDQHIDREVLVTLKLTEEQELDLRTACDDFRELNGTPDATLSECVHGIVFDFHQEQGDRAKEAKAMALNVEVIQ